MLMEVKDTWGGLWDSWYSCWFLLSFPVACMHPLFRVMECLPSRAQHYPLWSKFKPELVSAKNNLPIILLFQQTINDGCRRYSWLSFIPLFILSQTDGKLDYDAFFERKIQAKVDDNSYRRFRVLARSANKFPTAKHFVDPKAPLEEGRDITVWCSNDYLGMSKHPKVIQATT